MRALERLEELSKAHYVAPNYVATVYLGLGEDDKAMDLFEKSYDERCWGMLWFKIGQNLAPLRGTPRFEKLLEKMNFPRDRRISASGTGHLPQALD